MRKHFGAAIIAALGLAFACNSALAQYVGDYAPGTTVCRTFTTFQPSTGAAFALASGAVDIYFDSSDTQDTDDSGATLTASVDSVAGLNRICIDTSTDGTFYAAGRLFHVVLTAGTVDSVSVAGSTILEFSLNKEAALKPTTAGRTLDVSAGGEADANVVLVEGSDATDTLGVAQTGDAYARLGAPAGASVSADVADLRADIPTALVSGRMDVSVGAYQTGLTPLQPTTAGRTLDVTATGEAGIDWANIGSPTTSVNLSGTTISTSQAVASVSGAVGSVTGAVGSVTGNVGGNVTGSVGSVASGGITEASYATTAGSFKPLGIARQGTAQSATGTTLVLDSSASFGDDTAIGMTLIACGSTQGYCQARAVTDYVGSTDTATVDTWTVTPSGTITYYLFGTAPSSGAGGGLDAAGVRAAVGLASANLDTQLSGIQSDTNDIQTRIPAALVSGRIDASVGAMASGVVTATAVGTGAIDADALAADAGTELGTATWATTTRTLTAGTNIALAKGTGITGFNDLDAAGVRTAVGLATANLDTQIGTLATSSALATVDTNVDDIEAALGTPTDFGSGTATIAANLQDLADNGTAAYDRTTDSLQAIRDRGDAAWTGGGGGTADWTVDERAAMRTILGIPASGTTPEDPTDGILDDIRDGLGGGSSNITQIEGTDATDVIDARIAAGLATYDPPTRAELTSDTNSVLTAVGDVPTNAELATALGTADDAVLAAIEQTARVDAAILNCEVNTANFAGSTTTLACILTDRDGGAVTVATGDLEGRELLILSGAQIYEGRFINDTTWDAANSELRLTLSRALPATLADAVTAVIR